MKYACFDMSRPLLPENAHKSRSTSPKDAAEWHAFQLHAVGDRRYVNGGRVGVREWGEPGPLEVFTVAPESGEAVDDILVAYSAEPAGTAPC